MQTIGACSRKFNLQHLTIIKAPCSYQCQHEFILPPHCRKLEYVGQFHCYSYITLLGLRTHWGCFDTYHQWSQSHNHIWMSWYHRYIAHYHCMQFTPIQSSIFTSHITPVNPETHCVQSEPWKFWAQSTLMFILITALLVICDWSVMSVDSFTRRFMSNEKAPISWLSFPLSLSLTFTRSWTPCTHDYIMSHVELLLL